MGRLVFQRAKTRAAVTVWDWLASPQGHNLVDATILLISAIAAFLSYKAHAAAVDNGRLLNGHLQQHVRRKRRAPPDNTGA